MSLFFGGGGGKVKPQFTGLALQTSTSAVAIGLWYGRNRGAGNIIWQGDFQSHKQKVGGKGGGGKGGTTYTFTGSYELGLCWGPIAGINRVWKDQSKETSYAALGFSLFVGTNPQDPWGYLVTAHPDEALGYPDWAYLAVQNYDLGQSNVFPQHTFEVDALLDHTGIGGTSVDADPALIIEDFLANPVHGVGFNTGILSNLMSTVDAPTTGDSAFQTYCQAIGFAMSPFLNDQQPSGEILQRWADLCNTGLAWTGYSLKFHPRGPDNITANGVTYLANFPIRYYLSDDDFICDTGSDPITFNRSEPADAFNAFSIVIANRNNEYNDLPVPWRDQGLVDQYGLKNEDSMTAKEITDPDMAAVMVTYMGQRKAYIRNTFNFVLGPNHCLLEPMDVLQCTDREFGTFLVLITDIEENDSGDFEITAEEYPASISTNSSTVSQPVTNTPVNTSVSPGPVNPPILFEPPSSLAAGAQVWAAVSGGDGTTVNPNWGGANVWLSTDDITYNKIGEVDNAARQGKLTTVLATYGGTNPDTVHTLAVDLRMSGGELEDASSSYDAESGVTRSYVDGEILSYETTNLTGTDQYDLTDLWRAQYGTAVGAHAIGTDFARLDEAIFKYNLPPQYIGQLLYLKFQSFNIFGGGTEDLSTCTAYTLTPLGIGYGTGTDGIPAVPTGLAGSAGSTFSKLTWNQNSVNDNVTGYQVWRATGASQPFGSATLIGTTTAAASEYTDSAVVGGQAYTYFLVALNIIGSSANTSGINLTPTSTAGVLRWYGSIADKPLASEELFDLNMEGDEHLPINLVGSLFTADVASTGTAVFDLQKNGVSIGSITFTSSSTGVASMVAPFNPANGDKLRLVSPATQDATLSGFRYTFNGTRG